MIHDSGAELIMVPRINIHPGFTQEWLEKCKFKTNEVDWINWPDYQGRIFKNSEQITWGKNLHETITGAERIINLQADPSIAMWHIKSIEKQDNRWKENGDYNFINSGQDNLYESMI